MDKPSIMDPHLLGCLHQSTDPNAFKKPHTSGTGSLHSSSTGADSLQVCVFAVWRIFSHMEKKKLCSSLYSHFSRLLLFTQKTERLVGGNELYASVRDVRRLKKAARQCWIRWARFVQGEKLITIYRDFTSIVPFGNTWLYHSSFYFIFIIRDWLVTLRNEVIPVKHTVR